MEEKKFLTLPGLELVQPVASRYTDCDIPALTLINNVIFKNNGQVPPLFENI
jgi:hypothetical protein